jgi:hypothetical protein
MDGKYPFHQVSACRMVIKYNIHIVRIKFIESFFLLIYWKDIIGVKGFPLSWYYGHWSQKHLKKKKKKIRIWRINWEM